MMIEVCMNNFGWNQQQINLILIMLLSFQSILALPALPALLAHGSVMDAHISIVLLPDRTLRASSNHTSRRDETLILTGF